ncbi:MAG: outer membrane protein assembly factor BamD [Myxococcota bacterium]
MFRRLVLALATIALTAGLPACGEDLPAARPGTLEYTENARAAYGKAMRAFYEHDWEKAEKLFQQVRRDYSQSRYARWAELRLADIKFEQDQLAEAISAYKVFVQSHRRDPGLAYAHYRVCRALFLQINDTILLPPQEERDQGPTTEAYRELRRFKQEYPQTRWQEEIEYMLADVTGRLVRHELYVARFYLARDNFEAAASRARYGLRTYEDSGLEPEALVLLGEIYLKMKKRREARETFNRVLASYPASPFVVPARSFLEQMGEVKR